MKNQAPAFVYQAQPRAVKVGEGCFGKRAPLLLSMISGAGSACAFVRGVSEVGSQVPIRVGSSPKRLASIGVVMECLWVARAIGMPCVRMVAGER